MSKEVIKPEQFGRVNIYITDEDDLKLNAEQQQELDSLYESTIEKLKQGQLLTGKIISIDSHGVLVDIQYKSDGFIPRYEFSDHELRMLKLGNEIEVILDELESVDGSVVLSYEQAKSMRAWDKITQLFEDGKPVEGVVTHKVKGGLSVDIGVPAFLPGSQIDVQRVTDFDIFVGQSITAEIIKINKKRGNVIISRRKHLVERRADERKRVLENIQEGQIIQGVVKNITNYGVFIDIGGIDGLLYITDMTWGRIAHPSEVVKIGEKITVKVLSVDRDNNKISLGLKQLTGNPWEELDPAIQAGSKIKGIISSITDYGLFVEVQKGVEGLVHISEVSWVDRINDLSKNFKVGDKIEALVVSLDKDNRRMSLSIKQLEQNPWVAIGEKFKVGDKIKGTVSNVADFGVFIQLIPGVDGLAHISDLSWTEHIEHPGDHFRRGDEVEAIILSIDEANKKVSLGIKQLAQDPWENVDQEHPIGSIVECEIAKITNNFRVFARLPNGIEGLVFDAIEQGKDKPEAPFKVGDMVHLRVTNINKNERKLSLSTKLESDNREQQREPKYEKPQKVTVKGDDEVAQKRESRKAPAKSMLQIELEKLTKKGE